MKEIQLTQGLIALVDDEDYERLNQFKWHASKHGCTFYANRKKIVNKLHRCESMHWLVMGGKFVDHIDGNGLNNQKSNLRFCTNSQNAMNKRMPKCKSSQYKGVTFVKRDKNWRANIRKDGKLIHIGKFQIEEQAAKAYDTAAKEHFGEFAYLNFNT